MASSRLGIHIAVLVLLCLASIVFLLDRISINQSSTLEQMLTPQDKDRISRSRETFDVDSELVLVAIYSQGDLDPIRLVEIEQGLLSIPQVVTTLSAATAAQWGFEYSPDILVTPAVADTTLMFLMLAPASQQLDDAKTLSRTIREVATSLLGTHESLSIVGLPQIREASWEIGASDTLLMLPLLLLVTLVVTQLCFKSYLAIALSLVLTTLTTSICLALQFLLSAQINALVVLVVPIIWTLATLDAFHLYSRTVLHSRQNSPAPASSASRELFLPCLLTTVTTAGCFLTLTLLDTSPLIVSFGIWCTAGAVLAFILTFTVGKKLLSSYAPPHDSPRWPAYVALRLVKVSQKNAVVVVLAWAAAALVAVSLVPRMEVATAFPGVFSSTTGIAKEIEQMKLITGTDLNPIDLVIEPSDLHGQERDQFASAALLTSNYLKTIDETRLVLPFGMLGEKGIEKVLQNWRSVDQFNLQSSAFSSDSLGNWVNTKDSAVRLQLLLSDTSYERKREILAWVQHFDDTMLDHHQISLSGSGYFHFLTEQRGLTSLFLSSVLSLLIVGATLLWITRNTVQLMIAICGSIFPALILAGCMAAGGVPWTIAMLPMPVLLLGLMNDDTIHISWRSRRQRKLGDTVFQRNAVSAGPALLATTLVLSGAIATLAFSGIQTNQYLGVLIPLGLILAFLCNLTLLPALSSCLRRSTQ